MRDKAKMRQAAAAYRARHPDRVRESHRKNYYKDVEQSRANARQSMRRSVHGPLIDEWYAQTWETQQGCCYLCGDALDPNVMAHIDHDHACCPEKRSCERCRRGLACARCNHLIGKAGDDPQLLRRIADNLEAATRRVS